MKYIDNRAKNLSDKMRKMHKPAIDRQGGAIALASGIASNPGTVYAVAALGGMSVSPNLAAVREAIMNLIVVNLLYF